MVVRAASLLDSTADVALEAMSIKIVVTADVSNEALAASLARTMSEASYCRSELAKSYENSTHLSFSTWLSL